MAYSMWRHLVYLAVSCGLYWYSIFGEFGSVHYQMLVSLLSLCLLVFMLFLTSEKLPYGYESA